MPDAPRPRWEYLLVLAILLGHACVQIHLAWMDSDTIDEPAHLVAGVAYVRHGTFRLYKVNPPLSRIVQGLFLLDTPLDTSMIVEPTYHGERREMGVGDMFAEAHAEQYRVLMLRARLGSIVFDLLGGLLVWEWANRAFGRPCGLVALTLWCVNPFVLAHGHLATPDVAAAVLTLAAARSFRAYLDAPSWPLAAAVGATLGLAQLTKFTLVLLYPLWLILWLTVLVPARSPRRIVGQGLFALTLSLLVLNAGYLFQDFGQRLERFRFLSSKLGRFAPETLDSLYGPTNALGGTWLGSLPVPLPAPYVEGIDLQARDFDRYAANGTAFFAAGRWVEGGRYYYYFYGFLVKSPLALFALLAVAAGLLWHRPVNQIDLTLLLAVPLVVLLFVSAQTGMNKHIRYVLPMLPFLTVLAAASGKVWHQANPWPRLLVGLLLGWSVLAGVRACRDPLAYFNEAVGGPRGGVRCLSGSNVDWGQGRYRLRDWLDAHPEFRPVAVACYGAKESAFANLANAEALPGPDEQRQLGPRPGRFAVSVRILQGDVGYREYAYFQRFEPVATAGDSVWIFDVSLREANQVRADLGLPELVAP